MTHAYRDCSHGISLPQKTSWWRIAWAELTRRTITRLKTRRMRHELGIVHHPSIWFKRGLGRHFSDAEIDCLIPASLRKTTVCYDSKRETIVEVIPTNRPDKALMFRNLSDAKKWIRVHCDSQMSLSCELQSSGCPNPTE